MALSLALQGCAAIIPEREPARVVDPLHFRPGQPGLVIGAPHRDRDDLASQISLELARQTGFGVVVVTSVPPDRRGFDDAYYSRVREVAGGSLRLYVEIQAASREEAAGRIEIATVGVDRDETWRLRTLFELIRDARLRSVPKLPRLDVLVRPVQPGASGSRQLGTVRAPERGIQIELPIAARTLGREVYTAILAEFLTESSRLLLTPRK